MWPGRRGRLARASERATQSAAAFYCVWAIALCVAAVVGAPAARRGGDAGEAATTKTGGGRWTQQCTNPLRRLLSLDPVVNAKQTKCCFVVARSESSICCGSMLLRARFPSSLPPSFFSAPLRLRRWWWRLPPSLPRQLWRRGGPNPSCARSGGQTVSTTVEAAEWEMQAAVPRDAFFAQPLPIIAAISFHPVTSQVSKSLFVIDTKRILFWRRCQPLGAA